MKNKLLAVAAAAAIFLPLSIAPTFSAASSATKFSVGLESAAEAIPKLRMVSSELLRGGEPKEGGLQLLKTAGVRTVVNLRMEGEDVSEEELEAKAVGLNFISLPMSVAKRIPDEYIRTFLSIANDPQMQPVFVHCKHGEDRTGAMVAIYRMSKQGWSLEQSYREMMDMGFHRIFLNLSKSVSAFSERAAASEANLSLQPVQLGTGKNQS
jgi:protein tyrosine/serine phosphatase